MISGLPSVVEYAEHIADAWDLDLARGVDAAVRFYDDYINSWLSEEWVEVHYEEGGYVAAELSPKMYMDEFGSIDTLASGRVRASMVFGAPTAESKVNQQLDYTGVG
jgi:hypothetical protein